MALNKSKEVIDLEREESDRLIQEFLDKGGKVTICEPFATTLKGEIPLSKWGAEKKKIDKPKQ
jgi:hypothetical protein